MQVIMPKATPVLIIPSVLTLTPGRCGSPLPEHRGLCSERTRALNTGGGHALSLCPHCWFCFQLSSKHV